jgi:hypothetical protein
MGVLCVLTPFYGVFVRFSTRGIQKHHKNFLKKVDVTNFLQAEGKKLYSCRFFPSICFNRVFGRFSA